MKSYLDLVPIASKVHKRQNRMSLFCIVLAVFLVTVIFGMADMFIRSQIMQARMDEGNWHAAFRDISEEQAALISARPELQAASWYGVLNYRGNQGYTLADKNLIICGSDESWLSQMQEDMIKDGAFPSKDNEAMITENAKQAQGIQIGDRITVDSPDGTGLTYVISGFAKDNVKTMEEDSYGLFLNTQEFRSIFPAAGEEPAAYNSIYYVLFSSDRNIKKTITDITDQLGLSKEQVSENTKLLGLLGQSGSSFMVQIYSAAFFLFTLVLLAGIMMITSSLNSNVAQRTEFFGMIRCLGATPKQVMKLVRKEALNWCKTAIPFGIAAGVIVIWVLCAMLRYLSPEYFIGMPLLGVSVPSIISGICVGIITVLLAARSPAKRAARVSPVAAVSGNANVMQPVRKAANTVLFKVDTALGLHHSKSSKKNFVLMAGSFSLSIILFLSFSVTVDFMNHALKPLKPWTPDISIVNPDNTGLVSRNLLSELEADPAVERAYGRMFANDIPVTANGETSTVDLISYEKHQFEWSGKYVLEGTLETIQDEDFTGMLVFGQTDAACQVGDTVTVQSGDYAVNIKLVGLLSAGPDINAPDTGTITNTIICSERTFQMLTGQSDYAVVDLQLGKDATDSEVAQLHQLAGSELTFSDRRLGNRGVSGSFYSFGLFIYGFLTLIAFITILNIVNSISMSVNARTKQYGAMRAIGLSSRQLMKMVFAEAAAYAISGIVCGCTVGMICNKFLYEKLVSFRWGDPWSVPVNELTVIIALVIVSVVLAVQGPVKRIHKMSIVDTISAQ